MNFENRVFKGRQTSKSTDCIRIINHKDGYPLAYDIFEGNKFEGHTMLPLIDAFKEKYDLSQLIIVADSGCSQIKMSYNFKRRNMSLYWEQELK